ncbi:MAG: hypothetical protein ACRCVA_18115, partial [Phreatobacter sp.]
MAKVAASFQKLTHAEIGQRHGLLRLSLRGHGPVPGWNLDTTGAAKDKRLPPRVRVWNAPGDIAKRRKMQG